MLPLGRWSRKSSWIKPWRWSGSNKNSLFSSHLAAVNIENVEFSRLEASLLNNELETENKQRYSRGKGKYSLKIQVIIAQCLCRVLSHYWGIYCTTYLSKHMDKGCRKLGYRFHGLNIPKKAGTAEPGGGKRGIFQVVDAAVKWLLSGILEVFPQKIPWFWKGNSSIQKPPERDWSFTWDGGRWKEVG